MLLGATSVDQGESRARKMSRGRIIVIGIVVLLLVGGGTAVGLNAYRDARATEAAEALVESVMVQREQTDTELQEYADRLTESQEALDQLVPLHEMVQARADVFEGGSLAAFSETVTTLESKLGEASAPVADLAERFNDSSWGDTLVAEYRGANTEQRQHLETEVQQAIDALRDAQSAAQSTGEEIAESALTARHAAIQLTEQLPAKADELITGHAEASTDAQDALRASSSAQSFEAVTDETLHVKVDELLDHLIVYIESVDQVKASHTTAVEEREAAEAAAAAAAAAESAASSGGGGGARLCYRYTWLGTMLRPC